MATQLFPMLSCSDLDGSPAFYADLLDDVDEAAARARDSGVEIVTEPADMAWGERTAWIADPTAISSCPLTREAVVGATSHTSNSSSLL